MNKQMSEEDESMLCMLPKCARVLFGKSPPLWVSLKSKHNFIKVVPTLIKSYDSQQ